MKNSDSDCELEVLVDESEIRKNIDIVLDGLNSDFCHKN